jgi:putative ABC transport system permease protein
MTRLALRNLFQSRTRLVISVGGVALALLLMLALDAIFAGMQRQVTIYIDQSRADVFVAQPGVRNMHMASSSLPAGLAPEVAAVAGVDSVTPIMYVTNIVVAGGQRQLAYIIGLPDGAAAGGPWDVVEGKPLPGPGEAVMDAGVARKAGVGLGDEVEVFGRRLRLVGLARGTATISNSVVFIHAEDFAALRTGPGVVSFLLVRGQPGEAPEALAARIEAEVKGVTAISRIAFAAEERRVIRDMGSDVVGIMNMVGFVIGLAVTALTVYTATLSRRAEYGVLKAIGARNSQLYQAVLAQALISVMLGLTLGLALTLTLQFAVPRLALPLVLATTPASLVRVSAAALLIAGLSAVLPIQQIAGLDPALVFRGK